MSTITVQAAERLVTPPAWSSAPDYRRMSFFDGGSPDVIIMDVATIVDNPVATVRAEWQTWVRADGSVDPTLESVELITREDGYIATAELPGVIRLLTEAAQRVGVAL